MPLKQLSSSSGEHHAQIVNYDELKRVMVQNIGRSVTKSYATITKEKMQAYLKSPHSNLDNIRSVSSFLWRYSMPYQKVIEYQSSMALFSYHVIQKSILSKQGKDLKPEKMLQEYQSVLERLDIMHFSDVFPGIIASALRNGVYFGFVYDDENSFFISELEPKYCKITSTDGCYNFDFDATFFDQGNNRFFIDAEENPDGLWDGVFLDGYRTYKEQGREYRWIPIPAEKGICILAGDDPITPLPYYVSCFIDLLDLLDYQELIRNKTELENYVLLVSKIPMLKNTDKVNDFSVDLDLVEITQSMIDESVPSLVGTAYTPCELEVVRFNNKNQIEDTNIYGQALSNFMSNVGMSEMIGNSDKGGSVGLAASIKTDELLTLKLVEHLERWVKRYINLNISNDYLFMFHKVTQFNKEKYYEQMKDMATLGVPNKLMYATSMGISPLMLMNSGYFEQALDLKDIWEPLQSSYTQSGSSAASGKLNDPLTDEGVDTRDAGKNEGTKAKKEIGG